MISPRHLHRPVRAAAVPLALALLVFAATGCEQSHPTAQPDDDSTRSPAAEGESGGVVTKSIPVDALDVWRHLVANADNLAQPARQSRFENELFRQEPVNGPGHPAGDAVQSTTLGLRPFGVAVSRDGLAAVTRLDAGTIAFLDTGTGELIDEVAVGSVPTNVAFDDRGATAYVTCQFSGYLAVVDVASRTRAATVDVGADPFYVSVAPNGRLVYATSNANEVTAISVATREVVARAPVGYGPNGVAAQAGRRLLFVSSFVDGRIHVIDRRSFRSEAVIETGLKVQDIALSHNGKRLYAADEFGSLQVFDLDSGTSVSLPLPGGAFGMAVTPDRTRAYVGLPSRGEVLVVMLETMTVEKSIPVGGRPRRIAFTRSGDCAVVADEAGAVHFIR